MRPKPGELVLDFTNALGLVVDTMTGPKRLDTGEDTVWIVYLGSEGALYMDLEQNLRVIE